MPEPTADSIDAFITRWKASGGHERANYQLFLTELCDLLEVPRPDPARPENAENAYVFERSVVRTNPDGTASTRYLDLYRSGCFVLETKQGATADPSTPPSSLLPAAPANLSTGHGKRGTAGYDKAMERAFNQAAGYIRDLPAAEGRPPFLVVCDVGHVFELYAEFTRSGGRYQRFPDPKNHRIFLDDLRDPEKRDLLRAIWTDPLSLDPSKRVAKVTRDIAGRLAQLAKSLEADGHDPEVAALFLQRCLFTMFAEDIGLLPENGFLDLLRDLEKNPASFSQFVTTLWSEMDKGADSSLAIRLKRISHFNGGLFENPTALPLSAAQIALLIHAAESDWTEVDPAIFGTLLERALDPRERHKLGAHYTPRSYVERLIEPTVMEPLREEWTAVKTAAVQLLDQGQEKKARDEVESWHHRLCQVRILDPACGSGNFLYVTLEHLKRLEAEVLDFFESIGGDRAFEMDSFRVRPTQFLGIEINPSAARIAQLVLWIGYFQWQYRTTGTADTNDRPLLKGEGTIENRDAVLDFDEKIPRKDENGNIVTLWDGLTTKPHPVTGKEVPDESARKVLFDYVNPRRPEWPEADFIVGNPPFVGTKRMIDAFGEGYTAAVRKAWKGDVTESADFVMFWWQRCAELVRNRKIDRFGLITTNSIHQTFNRRVLSPHMSDEKRPMHLAFAIPDHPWVDSTDGAAVRIAMTVGTGGSGSGTLQRVLHEEEIDFGEHQITSRQEKGNITPALRCGAKLSDSTPLEATSKISGMGVALHGSGFILKSVEAESVRKSGHEVIKPYLGGSELMQKKKDRFLIDFSFLSVEEAETKNPQAFQIVLNRVKPERDVNRREVLKKNWWRFGWERPVLRAALNGLSRFIGTPETARHRVFQFIDSAILPDHKIFVIADETSETLGILSSYLHVGWANAAGGRLGAGNDPVYNKTRCFDPFPFPTPDDATRARIRELGEKLDAHRKRQQAAHPDLTLTGIYNVLEKLRAGEALTDKERKIHDDGLVSVLRQIHDDLDAAVFHAYGWDDLWQKLHPDPATSGIAPPEGHAPSCPSPAPNPTAAPSPSSGDPAPDFPPTSTGQAATPTNAGRTEPAPPDSGKGRTEPAPPDVSSIREEVEAELLERLVALNHERAEEEKRGLVRWLRPEFQAPDDTGVPEAKQTEIQLEAGKAAAVPAAKVEKQQWPDALPDQVAALQKLLPALGPDPESLAAAFGRKSPKRTEQIQGILATLEALGRL